MNTKVKGNICELECAVEFIKRGYSVSFPYGDNSRYDIVAEKNGCFLRIQCKKSRQKSEGCYDVPMQSTRINLNHSISRSYTSDETDYIATTINGECYLISPEECETSKILRTIKPKNNQTIGVSMADDYHIDKVLTDNKLR